MGTDHLFRPGSKWTQNPPMHPKAAKFDVMPASAEVIETARLMAREFDAKVLKKMEMERLARQATKRQSPPAYGIGWRQPGEASPEPETVQPIARVRASVSLVA